MKYSVIAAALLAAFMCAASLAQNTPSQQPSTPQTQAPTTASPQTPPETRPQAPVPTSPAGGENQAAHKSRVAPGSVLPVQLTKTVDAKKAKTGDQVVAKVIADMKAESGEVLVPKDTKVIGHVTEAQPRNKEQKESQLGINFDQTVMKDGSAMQMPMSIQAIIGQQQNNNATASGESGGMPQSAPAGGGAASTGSPNRAGGGTSGAGTPPPSSAPSAPAGGGEAQTSGSMPPITAQTQGVIGISNLQLSTASGNQGSVMTSDKNNVKLESGTMLLLKVQ